MFITKEKLQRIKARAKRDNTPFSLEPQDVPMPTHCPILGLPLDEYNGPSVDRIIPKLGYVKGNVIVICDLANRIKSNATPDEILAVGNFYKELLSNDYPLFY